LWINGCWGEDVSEYGVAWRFDRLNALEKVLVSRAVEVKREAVQRYLVDWVGANPVDPVVRRDRFASGLLSSVLGGGLEGLMQEELFRSQPLAAVDRFSGGGGFGGMGGGLGGAMGGPGGLGDPPEICLGQPEGGVTNLPRRLPKAKPEICPKKQPMKAGPAGEKRLSRRSRGALIILPREMLQRTKKHWG
jgi:hypothetical protein